MKIVTFGELLLRFSPPENLRFAQANNYEVHVGGAEANIAISLAQFGNQADFVTVVPDNDLGNMAVREVRKWGVNTDSIAFEGDKMGMYFMEKGASLRGGNIIYDRANSACTNMENPNFDWDKIMKDADWFHCTGITPALSQNAADVTLEAIKAANRNGVTVSCDLNFRSKLWNYGVEPKDIMPEIMAHSDVVLANEDDVAKYLGIFPEKSDYKHIEGFDERCYEFVSKAVMKEFPNVKCVISTLRQTINASTNRWSGVVYDGKDFIQGGVYDVENIVDRVGGGDSFMAAYIHGKLNFDDEQKALDFGLAASALKLSIHGDYNILNEKEVLNLMNKNGVGRIDR